MQINDAPIMGSPAYAKPLGAPPPRSEAGDPADTFQPQGVEPKGAAASGAFKLLGVRIPTTTKHISDEKREQIMSLLQPGDLVLWTDDAHPSWQVLEKTTMDSSYTHVCLYEGDGKILEATAGNQGKKGVVRSDLRRSLKGPKHVEVLRPAYKTPEDKEAVFDYVRSQMGKPYDSGFNFEDDSKFYCSELMYRAFEKMPNKIDVPLKENIFFTGIRAVAPDAFRHTKDVQVLYSDRSSFWKNMASHWPVFLGAAVSSAAAAAALGPMAGVLGFVGGFVGSTLVGNKLQTGEYAPHADMSSAL